MIHLKPRFSRMILFPRASRQNSANFLAGIVFLAIFIFSFSAWAVEEEKPLDNAQIIQMTKADLGDSIIIAKINSAKEVNFALSTDDLLKLKSAGVSKDVITAMLDRTAVGNPANQSPAGGSKVILATTTGEVILKPLFGDVRQIVAPWVGTKRFVVFRASVRRSKQMIAGHRLCSPPTGILKMFFGW